MEGEARENNAISGSALFNLVQVDGGSPIASPRLISSPHALSITVHLPLGLWNGRPNWLARSTLMENTLSLSRKLSLLFLLHRRPSTSSPLPPSLVSFTCRGALACTQIELERNQGRQEREKGRERAREVNASLAYAQCSASSKAISRKVGGASEDDRPLHGALYSATERERERDCSAPCGQLATLPCLFVKDRESFSF